MAEYGFIDYHDDKFRNTVIAVKNALLHKGLMYRYTNEDDFGTPSSDLLFAPSGLSRRFITQNDRRG
jgi:GH15 family glucan-1,4-alpha-glucosidase